MKVDFRECTLLKLDKLFGLRQVRPIQPMLAEWLESQADVSDLERQVLENLKQSLIVHVHDWYAHELVFRFIGPLMALIDYEEEKVNLFFQRSFASKIGDIELSSKPDAVIASGEREPDKPYFCFQAYKREIDPTGDPAGLVLAAMLVAQELNEHQHPIYGCYVKESVWRFVTLKDKEYSISPTYVAEHEEILTIFNILKGLKPIIRALIR